MLHARIGRNMSKRSQNKKSNAAPELVQAPPVVTDIEKGLSTLEVEQRISQGKVNGDTNVKSKSVMQILRENIITFFNFVFVVLAILIFCFLDSSENFFTIIGNFGFLVLVVFNALVGIFQELKAKRTIDKLSLISAPKVKVLRDGTQSEIATTDIVLDDITILSSGSQICADAKIVEGSIEVNESLITGEPDAIPKNIGDEVMSGSFVVAGNAKAQVVHIAQDNFATKISSGAKYFKKPNSEIWRSLILIVKFMASVIVPVGIVLFFIKYYVQGNPEEYAGTITSLFGYEVNKYFSTTMLGTVATVIGMIPSGLVALSSTVFCVSVVRLSAHKTLAQDLYCVETLARVDVLCLDKTGTITEGTMEVNEIKPAKGKTDDGVKQIIKNLTSALDDDNATINAMRTYVADLSAYGNVDAKVPFSSQRKWSGATIDGISYVMGAPEFVFAKGNNKTVQKVTEEMSEQGFRVIVLASSQKPFGKNALPKSLKLEGFVFITDKIRAEAPDTLRFFKEEGVTVKIISGDNPQTVRAVARRAGLEDADSFIDMSTLHTEEEIYDAADKYTIFGRVLPDQKLMLVKALKAKGHTVAMTGDGVNDVLALKESDCSIAMASGSDAAKNVSSLVLLDSNFASMPKVVAEGRRSINNLERSASLYIMKTIYNTLLAILFMIVTDPLPFTPQNLTIMGMVTIGIPSVILALEPNADRVTGRFLPKVLSNALPGGITVLFGAIVVILCNRFLVPNLTDAQAQTVFIWVVTFVGFVLLFKVSLPTDIPSWKTFIGINKQQEEQFAQHDNGKKHKKKHFNKARAIIALNIILYLAMITMFVGVYFVPMPQDLFLNFFNLNNEITPQMGIMIALICMTMITIFMAFAELINGIRRRQGDQVELTFEKLDNRMKQKYTKTKKA